MIFYDARDWRGDPGPLMERRMTAQPETRFRCDRCQVEENQTMHNTPMPRPKLPEGWLELQFGGDHRHLCGRCHDAFGQFMLGAANETPGSSGNEPGA